VNSHTCESTRKMIILFLALYHYLFTNVSMIFYYDTSNVLDINIILENMFQLYGDFYFSVFYFLRWQILRLQRLITYTNIITNYNKYILLQQISWQEIWQARLLRLTWIAEETEHERVTSSLPSSNVVISSTLQPSWKRDPGLRNIPLCPRT